MQSISSSFFVVVISVTFHAAACTFRRPWVVATSNNSSFPSCFDEGDVAAAVADVVHNDVSADGDLRDDCNGLENGI